jgi:hypothetical protein
MRRKDVLNQQLTREIETLKKDADTQAKTLRELKEILQTHINPTGPAQLRHRMGISAEPLGHGSKIEVTKLPRFKKELRVLTAHDLGGLPSVSGVPLNNREWRD